MDDGYWFFIYFLSYLSNIIFIKGKYKAKEVLKGLKVQFSVSGQFDFIMELQLCLSWQRLLFVVVVDLEFSYTVNLLT